MLTGHKHELLPVTRVGSELLLEGVPERVRSFTDPSECMLLNILFVWQVVLRSINSSSSAYAAVTFHSNFFEEYNVFGSNVIQAGVLMKVALVSLHTLCIQYFQTAVCACAACAYCLPDSKDFALDAAPQHKR